MDIKTNFAVILGNMRVDNIINEIFRQKKENYIMTSK